MFRRTVRCLLLWRGLVHANFLGQRPAVCGAPCTMSLPTWSWSLPSRGTVCWPRAGAGAVSRWSSRRLPLRGPSMSGDAVMDVLDAVARPAGRSRESADLTVGANLGAMSERVGDVRDEGACLALTLALQAEPARDAVRSVPEPAVGDGHRSDAGRRCLPCWRRVGRPPVAAHRVGGVECCGSPRPVLAGTGSPASWSRSRLEVVVVDRPVRTDPSTVWVWKSDGWNRGVYPA